jgi:hypothetical protein
MNSKVPVAVANKSPYPLARKALGAALRHPSGGSGVSAAGEHDSGKVVNLRGLCTELLVLEWADAAQAWLGEVRDRYRRGVPLGVPNTRAAVDRVAERAGIDLTKLKRRVERCSAAGGDQATVTRPKDLEVEVTSPAERPSSEGER